MNRNRWAGAHTSLLIASLLLFWACATEERRQAPESQQLQSPAKREELMPPTSATAASKLPTETSQGAVMLLDKTELSTRTETSSPNAGYIAANLMNDQLSPYLKSLTTSPVHWHPWSREHLEAAKELNRPVLVSIGASWSLDARHGDFRLFADADVAAFINERFVPIKVDADEHPDVAERYGLFYTVLRQRAAEESLLAVALPSGLPFEAIAVSWEMSTNELKAFLTAVEEIFRTKQMAAVAQADKFSALAQHVCSDVTTSSVGVSELKELGKAFQEAVLRNLVSASPVTEELKATPYGLQALLALQHYSDTKSTSSLDAAQKLLVDVYRSSLRDPVFGGYFHSIGTDGFPQGGKLLCDQAYLLRAFAWAYAATGKKTYKEAADEILRYLRETLEAPDGGFYSSQESDFDPSHEMAYFTWSAEEIKTSGLDDLEKEIILAYYGLDRGTPKQKVLLKPVRTLAAVATQLKRSPDTVQKSLDSARQKLRDWRYTRDEFPRVNKAVIVSWSAVAISAYCDAWRYLGDEQTQDFALKSASKLLNEAATTSGLAHFIVKGAPSQVPALLEDYVTLAEALLDCAEISGKNDLIQTAASLLEHVNRHFSPENRPPYRDTALESTGEFLAGVPLVPLRDGVLESPNAVAVRVHERLFSLLHKEEYRERAVMGVAPLLAHEEWWDTYVSGYARAVSSLIYPMTSAVIVGELGRGDTQELWRTALATFRAGKCVQVLTPEAAAQTDYLPAKDGKAIGYVCTREACSPPVSDPKKLRSTLLEFGRD